MTQTHDSETVDRMAAAMWRAEAVDAGTPQSVARGRTPEMFRDFGETNRKKWLKFARAALSAMPPQEAITGQLFTAADVEAAVMAEREACAVIVENEGRKSRKYPVEAIAETYCDDAAEAIRARTKIPE